jgi:cell division ATPase FtsA
MLVSCKDNALHIGAVNDLDYVLKRIPSEIAAYQQSKPPSTAVTVTLQVDGIFARNVKFDRDTKVGKADIDSVEKKIKAKKDEFTLTGVQVVQTFSVRMTLSYEYELGKCTGKEIVDAIRERLKELKTNGFLTKEPPLEEAEAA